MTPPPPPLPAALPPERGLARRLLVPVALALLLSVGVLGMTWFSFQANRRDALQLTDDTLGLLEDRIVTEVTVFLAVPERALQILAEFAGQRAILPHERPAAVESATALLRVAPMLALVGFADADGNWLMVRRDPATGALETKTIAMEGGVRRAFWTRRADANSPPIDENDADDRFDPRTRPWWRLAQANQGVSWTDLYVFFTDRQPGVTASRALNEGTIPGAVMVDVRLDSLSRFLARLAIGHSGRALILDREGRLVAVGDPARAVEVDGEKVLPAKLDHLEDPVLSRAFDLYRSQGPGRRVVEVDDRRYIMLAAHLPGEGRNWSLLMVVPQDDFIGFVRRNSLHVLLIALGVIVLAALIAWHAIRQALRAAAVRAAAGAQARRQAAETEAYAALAGAASVPAILRTVGTALDARRAGLWRLSADGSALACESQVDVAAGTEAGGVQLRRPEAPSLFAALETGAPLHVPDAAADPRTAELARIYLRPVGSKGLLSLPVLGSAPAGGTAPLLGLLWVEDAGTGTVADPLPFARTAAALLARAMIRAATAAPALPAAATAAAAPAAAHPARARGQALLARMQGRPASQDGTTQLFPALAVLVLAFTDDTGLAAGTTDDGRSLFGRVRAILVAAAEANQIPCVRTLGARVLFADGFQGEPADAARRLADLALALQDQLTDAFTEAELGLDFRMGLDQGPAIGLHDRHVVGGAVVAAENWSIFGEAVRTAESLAETAPPGAIQVSETAQAALAPEFLMRARGKFFVPDGGEIGTWLVAGPA